METAHNQHTNVFIVEDSAPIRARLAEMLGEVNGVAIVGEAQTAAAVLGAAGFERYEVSNYARPGHR